LSPSYYTIRNWHEDKKAWIPDTRVWKELRSGDKMWLESLQHPEELGSLVELLKIAKVKTVLEIGAGPCGTAVYFAEAVGPEGYVVSVDLPADMGGTPPQYEQMAKAKAENWELVRGYSVEQGTVEAVKKALGGRQVGLLFIDGEHTLDAARSDYETYRPLLEKDGIIAFHDITLPELWPFWCGLRAKRHPVRSMEFIDSKERIGFGIGALVGRDEGF
jgi:predicted O-methyltransferase YrrM